MPKKNKNKQPSNNQSAVRDAIVSAKVLFLVLVLSCPVL